MLPKTSYTIYINVIKIDIIHIVRRYDKVPNSGLGPKCTVPKSQGDPKIVKRGPNGDPVLSKKGTKWGPF